MIVSDIDLPSKPVRRRLPATTTTPSTDATTAATTQTVVTIAGTRIPPAPPPATQFLGIGRHPLNSTSGSQTPACCRLHTQVPGRFRAMSNCATRFTSLTTTDHAISSLCLLVARNAEYHLNTIGLDMMASKHNRNVAVNLNGLLDVFTNRTHAHVGRELDAIASGLFLLLLFWMSRQSQLLGRSRCQFLSK